MPAAATRGAPENLLEPMDGGLVVREHGMEVEEGKALPAVTARSLAFW